MGRALACILVAVLAGLGSGAAQGADSTPPAVVRARFWVRPVASLVLPGSGQLLAHQDRGALYLAVELFTLARIAQLTHEGNTQGDRFRDIAFQVARHGFATLRRDTVFEYYETMERFTASGAFNRDSGAALAPETDPTTFNGSIWLLARRTFWADPNVPPPLGSPEYAAALQFYVQHAVGPAFLWSWRDASAQQQLFRETISKSDNAYRSAQDHIGLLLANHVASAVDALISSRLAAAVGHRAALHTLIGPTTVVRLSLEF
jgi:hypothetical protein